ncbi:H2B3 protein, partial [Orthonyx spaldingii]|nr:H2B3 protein [Orthonyx spaldingii]
QVASDLSLSSKAVSIVNSFVNYMFEQLVSKSSRLVQDNHCATITSREVQRAVRLLLSGKLAKHTVAEGTRAITKYTSSK